MRKILTILLSFIVLSTQLIGCGSKSTSGETSSKVSSDTVVNIGVQTLINPELIVRYENWYEDKLGAKVNIVQFDSGRDVNTALASNSIDIAELGTAPASLGISNNLGYEVFWIYDVIGSAESLVAKNGSGINSVKDLKGKKVATPFSSTAHYSLLNALKLEGVSLNDVQILDMQPADINASWQREDIDAAYVWYPTLTELLKDGKVITDSEKLSEEGILTADVGVVRKEFAKEHPDIVKNYVKLQLDAYDLFNSDNEEAIKAISNIAGISEEDTKEQVKQFKYLSADEAISSKFLGTADNKGDFAKTLKDTADFLVEQKSIEKAPDLDEFKNSITGEFVEAALNDK